MTSEYYVRVFNSVDDIGKDSIDDISNDAFFTYGWFKTLEKQEDFKTSPFYVAVYKEDNLVAFTPCFFDLFDHYFSYALPVVPFMKKFLINGNRLGLWKKHVLLCYSPFCFRSKIVIDETYRNQLIFTLIYQKINEICRKERILFSSFLFVSEFDNLLEKTLHDFGYSRFPCLNTLYLDVHWPRFDVFLESFKSKRRKDIRRQVRKFDESGLIVELNPNIEELSERLAILFSNVFRKYNGVSSFFGVSFFTNLNKFTGDKIKLFTAKKGNETIGFSLLLRHKNTADVFMFGTDYNSRTNTDFAYFNLVYYEPIRWAIQEGISKIFYRIGAENVKLKLGCKPERTHSFVKCHSALISRLMEMYIHKKYGIRI